MNSKKQVLIFLQAGVGGAERMSVTIGKMLDRTKYDIKFCIVTKGNVNSKITDFIPDCYDIIELGERQPLQIMWRILKTILKEKPDIVFSSVLYLNNKILPFRWLFPRTKFIIRCENYLYTFSKKQHWLIKFTYDKADAIIAQTQEMKDELVDEMHISQDKIYALENPLDTSTIDAKIKDCANPYPADGKKHLIASGRFAYQKGFDLLVKAFSIVTEQSSDIDLYIIGAKDGNHEQEYLKVWDFVKKKHLERRVHCLGFQNNPYPYVKYADCFVLSSRWEGLPNVLIEALYLGTPAAAFKCIPIIERIVEEGKTGCLAEKENERSLAESISTAISFGRIHSDYRGAKKEQFTALFEDASNNFICRYLHLGGNKITERQQLGSWLKVDFDSYEMTHPFAARLTYGENWEMYSYIRNLRYLEYFTNKKQMPWDKFLRAYYWLRHRRNCKRLNITISPNSVGPGCHLQHRGYRFINCHSKIGKNCCILPMVLLGNKLPEFEGQPIVIGDNCYISTGVTILGPVTIGNNVTIAAGAVVTNDVPDNCIVGGVPAKVIKYK